MLVKNLVKSHKPITIDQKKTVKEALRLLQQKKINGLLVVDDKEQVMGVLSVQDIAAATVPTQFQKNTQMAGAMYTPGFFNRVVEDVQKWQVSQVMRTDFIRVNPDDNIMEVMADFLKNDLYIVPIFTDNKLTGVITRSEIKDALLMVVDQNT